MDRENIRAGRRQGRPAKVQKHYSAVARLRKKTGSPMRSAALVSLTDGTL
jgi:hypothetical protein